MDEEENLDDSGEKEEGVETPIEDIEDMSDDDQINENLFTRYEEMFTIYNTFGRMF